MDEAGGASKLLISGSTGKYDVPTPEPPNILSFSVDRCEAGSIKKKVFETIFRSNNKMTQFSIFRTAITANVAVTDKAGFARGEIVPKSRK